MNRHSFIALLVLLACSSCSLTKEQEPGFGRRKVDFEISLGNGPAKLSGSYFKEGDSIFIEGGEPVYMGSPFFYEDGEWSANHPIYWGEKQTEASTFLMLYPYFRIFFISGKDEVEFSDYVLGCGVLEDQDIEENYSSSDVMMAMTKAAPSDGTVRFQARHMLSQVNLNVTNKTGRNIERILLMGVKKDAELTTTGVVTPTGEDTNISAYKLAEEVNNSVWSVIIVPQTASPRLVVVLSSGEQLSWSLPEGHTFKSGKETEADIVLAADRQRLELKLAVGEWKTGGSLEFITEEQN